MSITDELREWASGSTLSSWTLNKLIAIADRIDAVHEKALDERKAKNGDMWLKGYSVCHEELMEGHPVIVADLEKAGWGRLPKDADGEYIHVGDVMEERSGHTFEVASLMAFGGSDNWLVLSDARNFSSFREPHDLRHYHAPTVEDVLREFFSRYVTTKPKDEDDAIIAEYAAKLKLVGDGE